MILDLKCVMYIAAKELFGRPITQWPFEIFDDYSEGDRALLDAEMGPKARIANDD